MMTVQATTALNLHEKDHDASSTDYVDLYVRWLWPNHTTNPFNGTKD